MTEATQPKRTPLYDRHVSAGARMTPFAGYMMPVQYRGIVEEHLAVRQAAGLFDVSHMGEVLIRGAQAVPFLQWLVTNDVASMYDGRAMYTVMCHPDGGIIDDLLVYRIAADHYMLVINAANIDKDVAWMIEQSQPFDVVIDDVSVRTALLALQGPATKQILEPLLPGQLLDSLRYYHFASDVTLEGVGNLIISRTGYTGEYGVEVYCGAENAVPLWDLLVDAGSGSGLLPAGLGARDTLRLEAGLPLYGNDLDDTTNPIEAGLAWIVKLDKGDFCGRDALARIKSDGPTRRLVGFELDERGIPRHGYQLVDGDGHDVGVVTSGSLSPVLERGIGLGYVRALPELTAPEARLGVMIRGKRVGAHVVRPPFHKNGASGESPSPRTA